MWHWTRLLSAVAIVALCSVFLYTAAISSPLSSLINSDSFLSLYTVAATAVNPTSISTSTRVASLLHGEPHIDGDDDDDDNDDDDDDRDSDVIDGDGDGDDDDDDDDDVDVSQSGGENSAIRRAIAVSKALQEHCEGPTIFLRTWPGGLFSSLHVVLSLSHDFHSVGVRVEMAYDEWNMPADNYIYTEHEHCKKMVETEMRGDRQALSWIRCYFEPLSQSSCNQTDMFMRYRQAAVLNPYSNMSHTSMLLQHRDLIWEHWGGVSYNKASIPPLIHRFMREHGVASNVEAKLKSNEGKNRRNRNHERRDSDKNEKKDSSEREDELQKHQQLLREMQNRTTAVTTDITKFQRLVFESLFFSFNTSMTIDEICSVGKELDKEAFNHMDQGEWVRSMMSALDPQRIEEVNSMLISQARLASSSLSFFIETEADSERLRIVKRPVTLPNQYNNSATSSNSSNTHHRPALALALAGTAAIDAGIDYWVLFSHLLFVMKGWARALVDDTVAKLQMQTHTQTQTQTQGVASTIAMPIELDACVHLRGTDKATETPLVSGSKYADRLFYEYNRRRRRRRRRLYRIRHNNNRNAGHDDDDVLSVWIIKDDADLLASFKERLSFLVANMSDGVSTNVLYNSDALLSARILDPSSSSAAALHVVHMFANIEICATAPIILMTESSNVGLYVQETAARRRLGLLPNTDTSSRSLDSKRRKRRRHHEQRIITMDKNYWGKGEYFQFL